MARAPHSARPTILAVQMRVRRAWVPPVAAGGVPAGRESCASQRVIAATACQVCHMLTGGPTMVLCNGCDRGFHPRCLTRRLTKVPEEDPNLCYTEITATGHGPWRSRLGRARS